MLSKIGRFHYFSALKRTSKFTIYSPYGSRENEQQEAADADVVVFDPQTVTDRATYQHPMEPSLGVEYLLVGGAILVDKGKLMEGIFPGKAIVGTIKR